jgi:Calcineurin-like phosphoesterase
VDAFPESPGALLGLSREETDRLLALLERTVPRRSPWVEIPHVPGGAALVFGDSHGDWRSTEELVAKFVAGGGASRLVGLGDYVDRSPPDSGPGSVVNALWLLSVEARWPDRVVLVQGNHELARRLGAQPHTLPAEAEELWDDGGERYGRLMALFERGPVAATTRSGAYLAHAGFPRGTLPRPWTRAFDDLTDERLLEITWAECEASEVRRGAAEPWGERALDAFLAASGLSIVLRGHDPDITGRPVYGNRCLTLHTSRTYERYGGVIAAWVPLDHPVRSVTELRVEHLSTEGRRYGSDP